MLQFNLMSKCNKYIYSEFSILEVFYIFFNKLICSYISYRVLLTGKLRQLKQYLSKVI